MIRTITIAFATVCIAVASAASAQVPTLPLPSPPHAAAASSDTIFDALLAISRAVTSNPRAAQAASYPYRAAVQQYNAGDYDRSLRSAVEAIAQTGAAPVPQPSVIAPVVSPTAPAGVPAARSVAQVETENWLGLARETLTTCGPATSPAFAAASAMYDTAVQNTLAHRYAVVVTNVQTIVDDCAATAPQPQASPK